MKAKKLRIILIVILTVIFIISAFQVIKITYEYKTAHKANAELQNRFVLENDPTTAQGNHQVPISIDFDALKQENNDIVGWIYCPDTPINYPVVKGKDNNQYLHTNLKGKYLVSGTIFTDYRNGDVGDDPNYIVYGHSMKNDTMFGTLSNYKKQSYYDAHPTLYFLTPKGNYIIELCAGAVVKRNSEIYKTAPQETTVTDIIAKSTFDSDVKITAEDNVITLSTCSYEFNNARYVVIGKMIKLF